MGGGGWGGCVFICDMCRPYLGHNTGDTAWLADGREIKSLEEGVLF